MIDDRQHCPNCAALRVVLYVWRAGIMWCECRTCDKVFKMPTRDERAALARALKTVQEVAAKVPR